MNLSVSSYQARKTIEVVKRYHVFLNFSKSDCDEWIFVGDHMNFPFVNDFKYDVLLYLESNLSMHSQLIFDIFCCNFDDVGSNIKLFWNFYSYLHTAD